MSFLCPRDSGQYCDATVGVGGHARAIIERSAPRGRVIGIDRDADVLNLAKENLAPYGDRVRLVHAPFSRIRSVLQQSGALPLDGCIADLGVSSIQLDQPERGFSFRRSGPLDMRMDRSRGATAAEIVNHTDEKALADLFYTYGGERRSRQLAHAIVRQRPLITTLQLAEVAKRAVGYSGKIHPATRAFQALRLAVNDELGGLERGLGAAVEMLEEGGRLVVISFHSLEDRIVKQFFRAGGWEILTRHVIRPGQAEVSENPRSRSARLRAALRRRQG